MPHIDCRYERNLFRSDAHASRTGGAIRDMVSNAFVDHCMHADFETTLDGRPFGPMTINQPDLLVQVRYYQSWNLDQAALDAIGAYLKAAMPILVAMRISDKPITWKIRLLEVPTPVSIRFS